MAVHGIYEGAGICPSISAVLWHGIFPGWPGALGTEVKNPERRRSRAEAVYGSCFRRRDDGDAHHVSILPSFMVDDDDLRSRCILVRETR